MFTSLTHARHQPQPAVSMMHSPSAKSVQTVAPMQRNVVWQEGLARIVYHAFWLMIAVPLLLPVVCRAQETAEGVSGWADILSEGTLETQARLWFLDDAEEPVLIPNSSLAEYLRLRREQATGVGPLLPAWTYSRIEVRIDATAKPSELTGTAVANVDVEATVDVGPTEALAKIPLQLDTLRVDEMPTIPVKDGRSVFQVSSLGVGYEWLLVAPPNTQHSIQISGKTTVRTESDRHSLRINLPMTACQVTVDLPKQAVDPRTRGMDIIEVEEIENAQRVTIRSRGGEVELIWGSGEQEQRIAAIEAKSGTEFSIGDPSQPWAANTTLELRWYGTSATNPIVLRLPPGGRFRSIPNYNLDAFDINRRIVSPPKNPNSRIGDGGIEEDTGGSVSNDYEELVIENFDIQQSPTLELQFDWEWTPVTIETQELSNSVVVPKFVLDAVELHRGSLDFLLSAQYNVTIERSNRTALLQQSRTEDGKRLSFGFDDQGFELRLVLRREQSLPIVRPVYHVHVDEEKLTLTAWLDCSFDPNQLTHGLGLEMLDWVIQENTARVVRAGDSNVNATGDAIQVRRMANQDDRYFVTGPEPEPSAYGSDSRVEQRWRIFAERDFEMEEGLEFGIPQIIRGTIAGKQIVETGSGMLLVTSSDNLLLRSDSGTGLLVDSYSPEYQAYLSRVGGRPPQVFRFQTRLNQPYWKGSVEVLPQQVSVKQQAEVAVLPNQIEIRQSFSLQVANKPVEELLFAVHSTADRFQQPQVYVDGGLVACEPVETLTAGELAARQLRGGRQLAPKNESDIREPASETSVTSAGGEAATTESDSGETPWQVYRLVAPPTLLGRRQIEVWTGIRWDPTSEPKASPAVVVDVPLAQVLLPQETVVLNSQWTLLHGTGIVAKPLGVTTASVRRSDDSLATISPLAIEAKQLPIEIRLREEVAQPATRIRNAWLQTAITRLHRRDRFCIDVAGASNELRMTLPKFVDDIRVIVDAVELTDYRYDYNDDSLVIPLPTTDTNEHTIEVSYFQQESLSWFQRVDMQLPRIQGVTRADRFYWQLVTPSTQHIAWCPDNLTSEWRWTWGGVSWVRTSIDTDFERLLKATNQPRLAQSMNRYVMSGQDLTTSAAPLVLSRFALWFPVGTVAIFIAFSVLNFPLFRQPMSVLGYAVLLVAFALFAPDFAMLIGQTTLLATSLVGLLWITQVAVDARVRRRSVFTSRPTTIQDASAQSRNSRGFGSAATERQPGSPITSSLSGASSAADRGPSLSGTGNTTTSGGSNVAAGGGL